MELVINYISILGSFALAISGALTAMKKRFDPFGVLIIAFVTAVGGGTIRDMLLNGKSVFWIDQTSYIYFILVGTIFAIVFQSKLYLIHRPLLFFDAIGLGLYTITGVQIGIQYELAAVNCVILGTITGVFGGILRDILVNEVPVIFKKEVYATVCILGAILYLVLYRFEVMNPVLQFIPVLFIIGLRLLVIHYNISLPSLYADERKKKRTDK
ncbi:trimeric intracellular cation channel family protein [Sunxiuqinia dokdonensis]|uniref:Membrane protein n=1 Tax=Sunxiuqinia dokdonensis TaxID=1409788 RepID=A0A0L8V333_9BACT|nr:trimeric intracellular cation channel family protein [Sunxiuqinia dokdonensis]KOH42910.1 membrane protein [Sunxiuqinia dokdonensis]